MREIRINSKQYKVAPGSSIVQRTINPFIGKLARSGSAEYSDFSQATPEEYYDFRFGLGKKRAVGSDARLDWSEGIDYSVEGQAVLGPLVTTADYATWAANTAYSLFNFRIPSTPNTYCYECTTAGTSHAATEPTWPTTVGNTVSDGTVTWTCRAYLATVKIIDFADETYFIQAGRILKWDGTNLDGISHRFINTTLTRRPTGDSATTDWTPSAGSDNWAMVDEVTPDDDTTYNTFTPSAVSTTTDLLTKAAAGVTGEIVSVKLYYRMKTNETAAYHWECGVVKTGGTVYEGTHYNDANRNTYVTRDYTWTTNPGTSSAWTWAEVDALEFGYRYYHTGQGTPAEVRATQTYIEITYKPTIYSTVTTAIDATVASDSTDTYLIVSTPTTAIYTADVTEWTTLTGCKGYLTYYQKKLYSIDTNGITVRASAANNIDGTWTTFNLVGDFGTVYDLFSGKLLADDTPVPYFTSTKGLFSLDVTNELVYKQEVNYAPLTNAGRVGLYWNANIWVATGGGITKISPGIATAIGPDQDDGLPSGYRGNVYDMVPVNNWLVFVVNGGTTDKSSIMKRNSSLGGNLQVYTTSAANKAIACLHHSPSSLYTNGRLWFGESTSVKYMMFPDTTHNVKQISTYTYVNDSGSGNLPIFRKLAGIPKVALRVAAITKSCDANEYVEVLYGLNGATPTTSLGTFKTSPKPTTLTFNSGLGTAFYTIQFAIKLYRGGTTTNSPELESLIFYYYPTPTRISAFTFDILARGEYADNIFTEFETLLDTATLVAFYPSGDPNKSSFNVKLREMPSRSWWEKMGAREGQFQVVVQEISKD